MKVQGESFHLNGHIIGFGPQTQKLESPYKTPSNTLAVKGLREDWNNTADTTDATDGQNGRRLKRIETRVFENCSA